MLKVYFLTLFFLASNVFASDFYVFPVREIEGINFLNKKIDARPLIDRRSVDLFTQDSQKQIISSFIANLAKVYPNSILHSSQVGDTVLGKYQYHPAGITCKQGFVAPINKTYAVVAGITRASYYEVDRGENIEILVPVTLNLQLIKPDRAKIVYTASSTQYTPFVISKKEIGTASTKDLMTKSLTANTISQINELLEIIKKNFDPKEAIVKILDRSSGNVIVDKGYETGFRVGDELEATLKGATDGKPSIFKVLSVDSGYAILKPQAGNPSTGEEYTFIFESPADDSRKPKLMPVYGLDKNQEWAAAVADLFVKDIGFKAPFQLAPVDINFNDSMYSIKAQANCVPWNKYPSAQTILDSRLDHPNFFIKFEMSQSPVFVNPGKGKSEENFITFLTAQVVDSDGNIIFSEVGNDVYKLERVGKQGLSLPNAKEISLKNALTDLMKNFLANVKLDPKQFEITDVQKGKFIVKGLSIPEGQNVSYEILRPLGLKINGRNAVMRIYVDQAKDLPVSKDGQTVFSYSQVPDYSEVKSGDILSVIAMPKGNSPEISSCGNIYTGKDSLNGNYLLPLINQVAYKAKFYQVSISDKSFYDDTNKLLSSGFYKFRLPNPQPAEFCYTPGYLIRKNDIACIANSCTVKFLTAMKITTHKKGVEVKDSSFGEAFSVSDVLSNEIDNLIGYKSMLNTKNLLDELSKRFNSK